ncbi:MAG: LacI family transcriptional regulator [Psychromonas sp.]|jgi:LacI family transcriptional regulator|uniref:LacI family DNA-binding transcriptional regulator n=1 Tax=Psychromonas sp. TaxID=1884585 RepID=UPI0039E60503
MSTIIDVCNLAGVSKTTVSRVINGTGQVKKSTQKAVQSAMEQLGFRPNSLAQALARNQTNSLGLVISDFQGAYWKTLLNQASISAELAHKELFITDGHNDCKREYEAVLRLADRRCDAIVLYSRKMSMAQLQKLKQQLTIPLVLLNSELTEPVFHTLSLDQGGAVSMIMNHLISYGHKKIACISGPLNSANDQIRFAAYQDILKQYAIPFNPNLAKKANYGLQDGYEACQELISSQLPFTALLAFNDDMALGALKALTEAGISVPKQVSIAGIDNNPMTRFSQPAISTVDLPIQEMMKQAIKIALKLAEEKTCPLISQYKGTLIQRDSIIPLNANINWLTS